MFLRFGRWADGVVGVYSKSPRPPRLTADEYRFLISVVSSGPSWSVTDQELVISKTEVGSVVFAATDAART